MKKNILTTALIMALGTSMTSCLDSDSNKTEIKATFNYSGVFNSVTDLNDGTTFYSPDCSYNLALNYTEATLSFTTTNLQLSPLASPGSLAVNNLPYKLQSSASWIQVEETTAKDVISSPEQHQISNVNFQIIDRELGSVYSPLIRLNYTVDNRYLINVIPQRLTYYGTLTSVNQTTGDTYTNQTVEVHVTIEPRKDIATLELKNVKFVEAMPRALDMTFPDIPFTTRIDGYNLAIGNLIPTINKDPFPSFPISNLTGAAQLSTGKMDLMFNCHPAGMDMYDVTIALQPTPLTNIM